MNLFKSKISEAETSLVKLQGEFDALNESFEATRNEALSLTEKLATMTSEFARVNEENIALKEQLETAKVEIVEVAQDAAEVDAIAANKAIDILASVGTAPVTDTEEVEQTPDIITQFRALKGKESQEFFNANKNEIFKALKN